MVGTAPRFLRWELPYFRRYFDLVDEADEETVVLAYAPDVLEEAAHLPARLRVAVIFPGFGKKPYRIEADRTAMLSLFERSYDLVFVNPGPMEEAFRESGKLVVHPFSVDLGLIRFRGPRKRLESLLHVSAVGSAKKDWERSAEIMRQTGLRWEVFPPRDGLEHERLWGDASPNWSTRARRELASFKAKHWHPLSRVTTRLGLPDLIVPQGYVRHSVVVRRYQKHDGFVHIARENPPHTDAKYTACLLEAGATGAILFWHDALALGNDFETIFSLSDDIETAAAAIVRLRREIDVEKHSRRTAEEIRDRCHPDAVVRARLAAIERALA